MDRKHVVTFPNRSGKRLFGILHEPLGERLPVAVVLLSPGVKNRVAPHRMYNKMAARFVAQGFWVLRFDFEGLGDSEGQIGLEAMADLYGSIQLGRYVHDTQDAMAWMRAQHGVSRFVLGGLCGGAITGVLAGAERNDVVGILGLGLPVMVDGSNFDKLEQMTAGQLKSLRGKYLGKLLRPQAWLRLLSGRSDLRMLVKSLRSGAKGKAAAAPATAKPAAAAPAAAESGAAGARSNANRRFPPAFERLLSRGCPTLLMFSEADRLYWEFVEKFAEQHKPLLDRHAGLVDLQIIPQANHVLTFSSWQQDMLDRACGWLARFAPHAAARPVPATEPRIARQPTVA